MTAPDPQGGHPRPTFEESWPPIAAAVARACRSHTRNGHDADDLYQRVMIRAWRGHATFRGDAGYPTWVRTILVREAGRLAAQRELVTRHEVALPAGDTLGADDAGPAEAEWIAHGTTTGGVRGAVAQAAAHGSLSEAERQVVEARLEYPDETWEQLGGRLAVSANVCAVAHCRAVPKLRVFLFLHRPDLLGGADVLTAAFGSARAAAVGGLTADEAEAFQALVLEGRRDYRRRGWQSLIRAACAKVAGHLRVSESVGANR